MNTNTISYGSVCSGIEAASVAWEVLGFPDNHTLIPVEKRKKITADEYAYLRHHNPNMTAEQAYKLAADGPRYKAIGNSMAVPVMRWIGDRIMKAIAEAGHD